MQLPDGRFADGSGLDVLDTSEALLALAAVSPASDAIGNGRFALLLARPGSLDLEARRLGAICGDRGLAFGLSLGADALAADGGLGDAPGAGVASVYATASFIEQLSRCNGDELSRLSRAAHALQLLQHPDGGFGLSGDDSTVEATAIAMLALAPVAGLLGAEPSVAAGAAFLLAAQLPGGAFGSGSATDTALSLLALAAAGADPTRIERGVVALEAMQAPDGSFGSVRTTALAARALGASRPDLRIEAGGITEAAPLLPGELGTVQVRIVNAGASPSRVRVGLFAGDPLVGAPRLGTSAPVDVPAGGFAQAAVEFIPGAGGPLSVVAWVDDNATVAETDEDNNFRDAVLAVQPRVALSVLAPTWTPELPAAQDSIVVRVPVRNGGARAAGPFAVQLLEGGVAAAPQVVLPGLAAGATAEATFALGSLTYGVHDFTAVAIPPEPGDPDLADDRREFQIDVRSRVDLVVSTIGIEVSEQAIYEGTPVQVRAHIRNAGTEAAGATSVRFYDGDPGTGGLLLGDLPLPPVAAGGIATVGPVPFATSGRTGFNPIHVVVDPENLVPESNEQNTAVATIEVHAVGDPAILASDVTITPAAPVQGDVIAFRFAPRNVGGLPAQFNLRAEVIDPGLHVLPVGTAQIGYLLAGQVLPVRVEHFTAVEPGHHVLRVMLEMAPVTNRQITVDNDVLEVTFDVAPSPVPDLTLVAGDVLVTPAAPADGDLATVDVRVENRWGPDAVALVRLYAGEPALGDALGEQVVTVPGAGSADASILWDTTGRAGPVELVAVVDPDGLVAETREDNNEARLLVDVLTPGGLDPTGLAVTEVAADALRLDWSEGPGASPATVRGYRVYRDGAWINPPVNVAATATVAASSVISVSAGATLARDGLVAAAWFPAASDAAPSWTATFPAIEVERVAFSFYTGRAPTSYRVELLVGGAWQAAATIVGNTSRLREHLLTPTICEGLRYVTQGGQVGIIELAIYGSRLATGPTYTDAALAPGTHTYAVRAEGLGRSVSGPSNDADGSLGDVTAPPAPASLTATVSGNTVSLSWPAVPAGDLAGYRLYRNGLNGAERGRLSTTISASTAGDALFDGSNGSRTLTGDLDGVFAVAKLGQRSEVIGIELALVPVAETYTYRIDLSEDGIHWTTVSDRMAGRDGMRSDYLAVDPPVFARYIRLSDGRASAFFVAQELIAYVRDRQPLLPAVAFSAGPSASVLSPLQRLTKDFAPGTSVARRETFIAGSLGERPLFVSDAATGQGLVAVDGSFDAVVTRPLRAASYRHVVEAGIDGGTVTMGGPLTLPLITATNRTDQLVFDGSYHYDVVAVDTAGNESAPVAAAPLPFSYTPGVVTNLRATTGDHQVTLDFNTPLAGNPILEGYLVFRAGEPEPVTFAATNRATVTGLANRVQHCFEVAILTVQGTVGPRTAPVCATPFSDGLSIESRFGAPALTVFPTKPLLGQPATLVAVVQQAGSDEVTTKVRFYDGVPEAGGVALGDAIVTVPGSGQALAALPWTPTGLAGLRGITAIVDPDNEFLELNEANNRASATVEVGDAPVLDLRVLSIDGAAFPDVSALLTVRDSSGQPATGLQLGDVVVLEDGSPARLLSLEERPNSGAGPRVDVVFVFDTSSSMAEEAIEVCSLVSELIFRLSVQGVDLRVSTRGMSPFIMPADCLAPLLTGTYLGNPITLHAEDWGPATTWLATNEPWRPGAARVVVPISDEGAYQGDPVNAGDQASVLEAAAACRGAGVTVYPLYSPFSAGLPSPSVVALATALAEGTGGVANLYQAGAGLADLLAGLFLREAAGYIATFETPNPVRDGSLRSVGVSATWRGLTGSGPGSYTAPLSPFDAVLADVVPTVTTSPSLPAAGDTVTITARLRNLGATEATTAVRFFDGDPLAGGTQVGVDASVSLLAGGTAEATAIWTATAGSHLIWAVVDPDGVVPESDETNNRSFAAVLVPGAVEGDLLVADSSIRLSPTEVRPGAPLTVEVDVSAQNADFQDVAVAFFLGEPGAGGTWVSTASLPLVRAGGRATATVVLAAGEGDHEVWVLVDPQGIQQQASTHNDKAKAPFVVLPAAVQVGVATDRPSYAGGADALVAVDVVNTPGVSVGGTGFLSLRADAAGGARVVATFDLADLPGRPARGYAYRIPATVAVAGLPAKDVLAGVEVDFTAALLAVDVPGAAFDPAAVRVFERNATTGAALGERAVAFEPAPGFDPVAAAIGTVRWYVPGEVGAVPRSFEIVFDRAERGPFPPSPAGPLPFSDAILAWRSSGQQLLRAQTRAPEGAATTTQDLQDSLSNGALTLGAGDFDGDGLVDLVGAGFPPAPEGLYRTHLGTLGPTGWALSAGNAWGSVGPGMDFPGAYQGFEPADLNHDGQLDLVVSESGPSLRVAYGRGDGTFAFVALPAPQGRFLTESSLVDVNEDGEPDLVTSGGDLLVHPATGPGRFGEGVGAAPGAGFGNALADFDEDGHVDVAFATGSPLATLELARGNGDGTFQPSMTVPGAEPSLFFSLDAADVDGDGHADLVVSRPAGLDLVQADALVLHRGVGDGTFEAGEILVSEPQFLQQSEIAGARRRVEAIAGTPEAGPGALFGFVVSTGDLAPGPYQVVADLDLADGSRAAGTTAIVIEPSLHPALSVATEAIEYGAGDLVTVRSRLSNPDANTPLEGTLHLTATGASGIVLYEVSDPIGPIAIDGQEIRHTTFALVGVAPGAHRVRAELLDAGGAVLVSAAGPLIVRSDLPGDGLSATIVAPSEVEIGTDFTATATLAAVGNTDYPAADVELSLVSVATGVSVAAGSGLHDLLRAAGPVEVPATFGTAALAAGPYLVVVTVNGEPLASSAVDLLSTEPPQIVVSGVTSGQLGRDDVVPVVVITGATSETVTLDGAVFVSGTPVVAEGDHLLEVLASNAFGTSTVLVAFSIDRTPPAVTIDGVADGAVVCAPVFASATATDAHGTGVPTLTLDGGPYAAFSPIFDAGPHVIVAEATDLAGNVGSATVSFQLDSEPPLVAVSGVSDGLVAQGPVSIAWTIVEEHPNLAATYATLDGAPFAGGSVNVEGAHVLLIHAEDVACGITDVTIRFALDNTAPALTLSGVASGAIVCGPVAVDLAVVEANPAGPPTLTLEGLPYLALSPIAAEGPHTVEASALDLAGNTGTATLAFIVDSSAPGIAIAGVAEGLITSGRVIPSWTITEAHLDGAATFAKLDGAPLASGTPVAAEGDHTLVVHAEDLACGVVESTIHFAIDTTPPVLSLSGVTDGAFYASPVTATLTVSDPHLVPAATSLLLDGVAYTSGSPIGAEGAHTLVAHAEDAAGNVADVSVSFVLDFTPPVVSLAGVAGGEITCGPVLVSASVTDQNPGSAPTLTLDGAPYTPGSPVVGDGVHSVVASAQDLAGNTGTASLSFTLDSTPPTIAVAGVADGALVSSAVTVSFAITELHADPAATFATLDGAPFSSGSTIAAEGAHTLVVHTEDLACGVAETSVHFDIDSTPPAISITGVTDGAFYNAPVAATVAVTDLHLVPGATSILLDGVAYLSGTPISSEGSHTLSVHAEDGAGNAADSTVSFVLDTTAPAVALSGVNEGDITCGPVAVGATASDANLAGPPTLTLDGAAYLAFDPIAADGDHLIEAHAGDLAGNSGSASRAFTIDTVAPQVALSGVSEGLLAHGPVTPVWTLTELHLDAAATYATLDGLPFASGTAVSGEGDHVLVIHAEDLACGATETITHFTLDTTPPVIEVSGVMDGAYTAGDVTIIVTVTDAHPGPAATVLLDGLPYVTGAAISAEGAHTLAVHAEDGAGNTADRTVSFVIDRTAPVVALAGIAEASITCGPVAVSVSSTDGSGAGAVTVTLDGAPYTPGSPITAGGDHVVLALATDLAGNTAQAELHFVIDVTSPVVTVSGVSEGLLTNQPVAPLVTVTDAHLRPGTVTQLDGAPFISGTAVTTDGDHTLFVHAEDLACGLTETTRHFSIDATPPSIVVAGVGEGAYYPAPVAATVTVTDLHLTVTHTLLDGAAYASGTPTASEGPHVLTVHAEDGAGNSADPTISFILDLTAPVIAIAGVEDGGIYTGTVVATLSASDASPVTITSTLDGAPYSSGTSISGSGPHLLEVTAIDAAGNEAHAFAAFELRTAVPEFRFGLCSTRGTSFENSASVVSAGAPATLVSTATGLSMKHSSRIWGDAVVGADLSMRNSARITGTASIAGAATFLNSSGVGALVHLPAPPEVCTCGFDATAAMADAAASNDNALLAGVVALTGGRLELTHREAVLLPAGRYYVTGLTLEHQATLGPAPGAAVELYVDGAISVRNLSVLGDPGGDPTRFLVVSTAGPPTGTAVLFENNTAVGLRLYAPDADVTIDNSSEVVGGIVGGSLLVRNNGQLISTHSSSGADALVCP